MPPSPPHRTLHPHPIAWQGDVPPLLACELVCYSAAEAAALSAAAEAAAAAPGTSSGRPQPQPAPACAPPLMTSPELEASRALLRLLVAHYLLGVQAPHSSRGDFPGNAQGLGLGQGQGQAGASPVTGRPTVLISVSGWFGRRPLRVGGWVGAVGTRCQGSQARHKRRRLCTPDDARGQDWFGGDPFSCA